MVEVQSFILAGEIGVVTQSCLNIFNSPITEVFPTIDEKKEHKFITPFVAVLRRESEHGALDFDHWIELRNKDNLLIRFSDKASSSFLEGHRFFIVKGIVDFLLPGIGDYVIYYAIESYTFIYRYRYDFISRPKEFYRNRANNEQEK